MARKDIVARIGRLARAVAISDRKGDDPGVEKWSIRLADASTSLAVLVNPELAEEEELATSVPAATPPPNFGESDAMSSGLYNEWVSAWIQRTFPDAYVNWPPEVKAISPEAIRVAAKAAGCLAQVSACGTLGFPGGPWDAMGDWSLYSALVSTGGVHSVWHMGKLVGTQSGGDGLEFAKSLGFNW